jgi:hypothetical protein
MPRAFLQKRALGGILGAGDRGVVGLRRFLGTVEPPEQVGADRVEQVVRGEVEPVD